jgi:hypothetical protein
MLHRRLVSLSRHGGAGTGGERPGFVVAVVTIGDQVEPVNPPLITASTSSRVTPRRLSIS